MMLRDGQIEKVDSEYNTIFVDKQGPFISLNFGYRQNRYTESVIDLQHRDELVVTYTRYMTASLAYQRGPLKRIALVGLGGGRTISYLVASLPGVVADVAELDPAVISLAKKYFGVDSTDRLHIHSRDGRVYLNQSKDKYDVILLDAYRGPFVPFHLTTQEFYRLVKSRLADGGVVAQNVEPSTMFFDSAYATMKSVFEQVDAIEAGGNVVLIAYAGPKLSQQELAKRASEAQERLKMRYDLRDLVKARRDVTVAKDAQVLTDDFAPVEMLKTVKRHNEKRE
jgi:spermidine synthase